MTPSKLLGRWRRPPISTSQWANAPSAPSSSARSARGICAILLGDDPEALTREKWRQFPKCQSGGRVPPDFEKLVAEGVGFVEAPAAGLGLPLDIRGTAFQQRVWQALKIFPRAGSTASYTEVAKLIGSPKYWSGVKWSRSCHPLPSRGAPRQFILRVVKEWALSASALFWTRGAGI